MKTRWSPTGPCPRCLSGAVETGSVCFFILYTQYLMKMMNKDAHQWWSLRIKENHKWAFQHTHNNLEEGDGRKTEYASIVSCFSLATIFVWICMFLRFKSCTFDVRWSMNKCKVVGRWKLLSSVCAASTWTAPWRWTGMNGGSISCLTPPPICRRLSATGSTAR